VLRLALLTTAKINDAIVAAAERTDEVQVVGVASRDPARAEAYATERGLERWWRSYAELLADGDVDAVYVALPNVLHVEWSVRALQAGKHVLCEKPMGRDPDAVARPFAVAERAGLLLMEGFMYRHHPQIKRAQELLVEGAIGELRLVRAQFDARLGRPDDVRWIRELGGGALLDVGCYCVNALRLLAGEPLLVYGDRSLTSAGVDARFAATLRFGGGVLGTFDCALDVEPRQVLEAIGSDGAIAVQRPFTAELERVELRRGGEVEELPVESADRYHLQLENFARAARGAEPPLVDASDSIDQARVLDALLRSAESEQPVSLVEEA
jgi:D-xylose 1-dehydrogenase (NADP+, D-xylono-1,5-lactone-forming)